MLNSVREQKANVANTAVFYQLMQQYELYLSQNQIPMVKACERQLAYLVRVVNSLFSFGMPAGMIKLAKNQRRAAS